MSLVLNIDTALDRASVSLAHDAVVLQSAVNENQKDHAVWLHTAIKDLLEQGGHTIDQLEAVAVTIGPGSYTGLRIGLAAAKGFCYALNIPLLTVNTLEMMVFAVKEEAIDFICPMIDARRMEVFTAVYNKLLIEEISPRAMILNEDSFQEVLSSRKILFCGKGSNKFRSLVSSGNASFSDGAPGASDLAQLSFNRLKNKAFDDLAYTEPLYLKEFYLPAQKK